MSKKIEYPLFYRERFTDNTTIVWRLGKDKRAVVLKLYKDKERRDCNIYIKDNFSVDVIDHFFKRLEPITASEFNEILEEITFTVNQI